MRPANDDEIENECGGRLWRTERSTKYGRRKVVSLSSGEIYDSNAQNRFRMAPRRLDRRSERVFHFQRTVERISRRARKEEY